jgi:hypothetical protein
MELISDDLQGFVDWYIGEKTNNIKADKGIKSLKVCRFQQLHAVARILYEGFRHSGTRAYGESYSLI